MRLNFLSVYGYLWWVSGTGAQRTVMANGYGGQWIRVYPALQLVVAATSRRTPDSAARDQAGTLIQRHVVPALRGL